MQVRGGTKQEETAHMMRAGTKPKPRQIKDSQPDRPGETIRTNPAGDHWGITNPQL